MIAKYLNQFFSRPPLMVPVHCHLQGGGGVCDKIIKYTFLNTFFSYYHSEIFTTS